MSYQVLARKYRPRNFQTLVGQEHVVRALTNALEQQRLHHAYLFTGTRGVGKTTLSRILAKSLNCERGITAHPCGECDACVAIDGGRFVDYIEMDAASNRGVDEMAQLLEQAVYAPSNARFKVYMIDEVHMLTNHAFNSMLKTLEEPPAHVKFILATTDPQKIPVTVLSRCLQFNLKQMALPSIVSHLNNILEQEKIDFELPALRLLAQGARGSMRDALSLTDQAIAYAAGRVTLDAVQGMLGALDQSYLFLILDALAVNDGVALLAVADQMLERSLSYKAALQDLATMLHQVSIAQLVPDALAEDLPERAEFVRLAQLFDAEQIQLCYQIAVHGRNELGLAPDEYAGFSMTLLRMLAFRPISEEANGMLGAGPTKAQSPATGKSLSRAASTPQAVQAQAQRVKNNDYVASQPPSPSPSPSLPNSEAYGQSAKKGLAMQALEALTERRNKSTAIPNQIIVAVNAEKKTEAVTEEKKEKSSTSPVSVSTSVAQLKSGEVWTGNWPELAATLSLRGVAQQLAQQSELILCSVGPSEITLTLRVPLETLLASDSVDKLTACVTDVFTLPVKITTEIGLVQNTANAAAMVHRAQRLEAAEIAINNDQVVQSLIRIFGASIVPGSVKPLNSL